ncbi:MAG: DUF4388 domain-containing protein [Nannocystaceae bacterium]
MLVGDMTGGRATPNNTPGILYYDPNPTTVKLAAATLRVAGYQVFHARTQTEAVTLCGGHGPSGDDTIVALLLDASRDPKMSARVLRALIQLPDADRLPGILITSQSDPTPIPGAEGLPTLQRPFSSEQLLRVVKDSLVDVPDMRATPAGHRPAGRSASERERRLERILCKHLKISDIASATLHALTADLDADDKVPNLSSARSLVATLGPCRLEALLNMLDLQTASGVMTITRGTSSGRLHLRANRICLAEYSGEDEDLKLGRFVVEGGHMAAHELETFMVGKDTLGRPMGRRLADGGLLTEEALAEVLVRQAREVTCHLLSWTDGVATFLATDRCDPLVETAVRYANGGLLIVDVLLAGLRRLDETAMMGQNMGQTDDVYIRSDEHIARLEREALTREELTVLELINGRHSVKDLARKTKTGTFAVARVLYRLSRSNLIRRSVLPVTV